MSIFESLLGKVIGQQIDEVARWIRDSKFRIFVFVIIIGALIAIIRKIDLLITWTFSKVSGLFLYFWELISGRWSVDVVEVIILVGIIWYLGNLSSKRKKYRVDLRNGINQWSTHPGTQWSIMKDKDVAGKVLSVTQSMYPGILKRGLNWYDYTLSFQAKIIDNREQNPNQHKEPPNFTFAVRAKDRLNAIFFQCREDVVRPHFVSEGRFVIDEEARYQLPFRIPLNEWVSVKVKVEGDFVDIFIEKARFTYRIPTALYVIPVESLSQTMRLQNIRKLHEDTLATEAMRSRIPDEQKRSLPDPAPKYFLALEYDRGTIGFREADYEQALFRNIEISGIEQ